MIKINMLKNNRCKMKEMMILVFAVLVVVIISSSFGLAYTPPADSPLAKGEHPRLHITPATLPALRQKGMTDYKDEYQQFIRWVASNFDNDFAYNGNSDIIPDYHALICLLNIPESTNLDYGKRTDGADRIVDDYCNGAMRIMLRAIDAEPLGMGGWDSERDYWNDGSWNAMARAYDWVWHHQRMSEDDDGDGMSNKREIALWLLSEGNRMLTERCCIRNGDIRTLWSSFALGAHRPWMMGLALYGDGINDEEALQLIGFFERLNLGGKIL